VVLHDRDRTFCASGGRRAHNAAYVILYPFAFPLDRDVITRLTALALWGVGAQRVRGYGCTSKDPHVQQPPSMQYSLFGQQK